MATMTSDADQFLARRPRYAMLTTLRGDGSPTTVPVWFEWNGRVVAMFCGATSTKLVRLRRDPRVTVLVGNEVDEPEYWVAFDGEARIGESGGSELAQRLAPRYWDLEDPQRAATLGQWTAAGDAGFRLITLEPEVIRTYS